MDSPCWLDLELNQIKDHGIETKVSAIIQMGPLFNLKPYLVLNNQLRMLTKVLVLLQDNPISLKMGSHLNLKPHSLLRNQFRM